MAVATFALLLAVTTAYAGGGRGVGEALDIVPLTCLSH